MTFEIIFVLALILVAVVLFATEKLPVDLTAIICMAVLMLSGILTPEESLSGFSNAATITVAAMFILSAGFYKTGTVNIIGDNLLRLGRGNVMLTTVILMGTIGFVSAFINNTAAVAIFLPICLKIAQETNTSPSRLLMPLSFASIFGGVCTLIGTSTNLLVSSIATNHGQRPFEMFEFTRLGLIMFGAGSIYTLVAARFFIPDRRTKGEDLTGFQLGKYVTQVELLEGAVSVGKTVAECSLAKDLGVEILEIERQGRRYLFPDPMTVLEPHDHLRIKTDVSKISELQDRQGIKIIPQTEWMVLSGGEGKSVVVEAVVAPNAPIVGKMVNRLRFRQLFGAAVLAVRQRGQVIHEHMRETRLRGGDVLLVEVRNDQLARLRESRSFVIVSEPPVTKYRTDKILISLLIVACVVISAATGALPIVAGSIVGSIMLILSGCITVEEAYHSVEWKVIFLLAGVMSVGVAMEKTGAAALLSQTIVGNLGLLGPVVVISGFYILTSILTEVLSNAATAVLMTPIAIAVADKLGFDARPLLMAITFAASASFMTPVGYQTNTLIYGPGQYKFTDFLRVGTPLNILFWAIATYFIPIFWPP